MTDARLLVGRPAFGGELHTYLSHFIKISTNKNWSVEIDVSADMVQMPLPKNLSSDHTILKHWSFALVPI